LFRKAAQKPGSPGLRHKPPVFLQAKTHAPRPFRSLPQAGTCAKAHGKISRVCEAKPQRGADTRDPCHRQGRAQKRTVTRCKNKIQKKSKNFKKREKSA